MPKYPKLFLAALLTLSVTIGALGVPDPKAIVERVRAELAEVLKKDVARIPVDKPVQELGAEDIDVIEWTMAVEEAFHVSIPDEKLDDPTSKATRKDLSVTFMASLVATELDKAKR